MGGALAMVAVSGALAALSPLALKQLLDAVASIGQGGDSLAHNEWLAGALYLGALGLGRLVSDLRPMLVGLVHHRLQTRLSHRFLDHCLQLPMAYLHRRKSGELVHSLDLAVSGAQLLVSHLLNSILPVLIELITMTLILAQLDQALLLAVFCLTALAYLLIFTSAALGSSGPALAVSAASLQVHGHLQDDIGQVETLRCFGAEAQSRQRLQRATAALESSWSQLHRVHGVFAVAATLTFVVGMGASLTLAAEAAARGRLTAGGFVLANLYMLQMVRPLEVLGAAARDLTRALGFLRPLRELLAEPLDAASRCPPYPAPAREAHPEAAATVVFQGVHFSHEPSRPLLAHLDLVIPAGRTTAIVGRSGSGKSSLVRLLLRLDAPQAGRITLDGRPLEDWPAQQLRAWIGLVPQDTALMHATIAENIAVGSPDAQRCDIERAAHGAQLDALMASLPQGLDTVVGARGLLLSGGERQRIAIARALLRRPRLFVLDEPTSMLDSKTEAEIHETLRCVTAGCTTLVIAHRLSTIMHADEILVLEGGQVQERGRHAELLAQGGLYADLWRQQMALRPETPPPR